LNARSTWRFNARMTPMRANIVGPPNVATKPSLILPRWLSPMGSNAVRLAKAR
jgi:hypothetical protein